MKGGPIKMSIIAHERIARQMGTDWQPSEEQEQAAVIEWKILMMPQFPDLKWLHHVPNGGERHPAVAAKMKAQGVVPGVPDLDLPVARCGYHGLRIEMKRRKGGRLSEDQKEWIDGLNKNGYLAVVANGSDEACDIIYKYLTGEL